MTLIELPDLEQGSEAWHDQRRGIVTASVVGKLIALGPPDATTIACPACKVETGACISLSRKVPTALKKVHDERSAAASELPAIPGVADNETSSTLTASLVAERITGISETLPPNRDMNRGIWSEPYARDLYAAHYGKVAEVGFMRYVAEDWTLGYSPDGLVGDDGLIEIKAPRSKTQVLTVLTDDVPAHYMAQCQAGLLVSGRKWLDFVSYAGGMHIYVKRVLPDPAWFAAIEAACRAFETKAAEMTNDYLNRVSGRPVAPYIDFELEVI